MPKLPDELVELEDQLINKSNKNPLEFTLKDYITLEACQDGDLSLMEEFQEDMGGSSLLKILPDGYESITLPAECAFTDFLYQDLELFREYNMSRITHPTTLFKCDWNGINFHILGTWERIAIFPKSEIDKLKSIILKAIQSKYPDPEYSRILEKYGLVK